MLGGLDLLETWRISSSNSKCVAPSMPLHFEEEDPLSQLKDNIAATPSLEPKAGEAAVSPTSNSQDLPPDGRSVKGNVDAPLPTLFSSS